MIISVRVPDEDGDRVKEFAVYKGVSVSELMRSTVKDRMDSEYRLTPKEISMVREKIAYAELEKEEKRIQKLKKQKEKELAKKRTDKIRKTQSSQVKPQRNSGPGRKRKQPKRRNTSYSG